MKSMFSEIYYGEIRQYFDRQMELLENRAEELRQKETELPDADKGLWHFSHRLLKQKTEEIRGILAVCSRDEAEALQFLYSAMPLSDILNYPASVYLAYARHGVFLWQEGPFAGKVPERIFTNYVLHHRVHNEDIADTRGFFYERLKDRTAGKSMYEAAVETNFWCVEKATYQSTFMRTQNPLTMYGTAIGRCGEEAPFVSTALRSIGIPAREVSAPWWAHCDDNHAWVEAWCDGNWHFLGGCEPEKTLDKGWFIGPAARAMMIESRWFGKDKPLEPIAGRQDMSALVNHMRLYADTLEVRMRVENEAGNPVPGARVDFMLLNYARFNSMASLVTGTDPEGEDYGTVRLETGYGDLLVCAYAGGSYGEMHICLGEDAGKETGHMSCAVEKALNETAGKEQKRNVQEYTIRIKRELEGLEQWREMDFHAPGEVLVDERKTDEEFAAEKAWLEAAAESRRKRLADFYQEEAAQRVLARFSGESRDTLEKILHQARGNMGEIVRFLEWDFGGETEELEKLYGNEEWRLEALKTLRENDYWDIRAEVLAECSSCAAPYASGLPREIYFSWLLCPSAMFEKPTVCREVILEALGEELQEKIRRSPGCLPGLLEGLVIPLPDQEYANLITFPRGCLTGGMGSEMSRAVLCIQIYRALGIPARMKPMSRTPEYYEEGSFVPAVLTETESGGGEGRLVLKNGESLKLEDWKHYSLSRFEKGRFMPLFIRPGMKKRDASNMELALPQGIYRILTTNRLPNGNQFVKVYDFQLEEGRKKQIELAMRDIPTEAVLEKKLIKDMILHTEDGKEAALSVLGGGRSLFLWLELAKEPTEHVLNELYEKKELFGKLEAPVYFVVRKGSDHRSDVTLKKVCEALPRTKVLLDDFGEAYGELSYQAGRNPGKLPLAMILEDGNKCIYSDAGYNVGMADLLLRILT